MNHLFQSFISLTIALFFLMLGIVSVMLPWSPTVRMDLIRLLLDHSIAIFLFGFGFIIIGLAVIINIAFSARRNYYRLKSGPKSIWVDETVIQNTIDSYWTKIFPKSRIPNHLTLKKNKIHLVADLPFIPLAEQKELLEKIKIDLSDLLATFLGYRDTFYLSASFQPEDKSGKRKIKKSRSLSTN